ncbi:MAG: VOC family protein [Alphaproteobacteria bacterium]|nr:VOC family protein [Alphaproteobacteria bacterium]MDE2012747.1 VOC family protein [Alphaproteobacteria bacterium]MDE2072580.1 VOC family protein [Alphaproteobacteria bacterium]MDE2351332.1 VOC family protein [Alphaproteobacteria bacterium]
MALEALEHVTINCADLAATRDFYCDVLGLREGYRPQLSFDGYWIYCGEVAVVHLLGWDGAAPENRAAEQGGPTGSFDHVAFSGREAAAMIARLKARRIAYRENHVADIGLHQLFVRDPNGVVVEMNFRG